MADQTSGSFSAGTAAVYIFNLIVGTGALALPAAFAMAGWASATVLLLLLALLSYITASWVVETMAACNAIITIQDTLHSQQIRETSKYVLQFIYFFARSIVVLNQSTKRLLV